MSNIPRGRPSARVAACLVVAVTLTIAAWIVPDMLGVNLLLPPGRSVVVWTARSRAIAVVGMLLWALACRFAWRRSRSGSGATLADAVLLPLAFLPLSLAGFFLVPLVPQAAAANLLFFLPVFLAATSLFRWLQRIDSTAGNAVGTARWAVALGIGLWLISAAAGWCFTISMTKPTGDTGHYIAMATSLYQDHDLDIRNNINPRAAKDPEYWHISRFSRDGHLYSWHSFGLSLLLAPFVPGGAPARHLILGLFAGLCAAGLWELCRLFGAARHWSLTVILLFAFSRYWGIYSSLCLPEVAGAALTTWGVVAILRQHGRPWGSGWVCVACCAYLPWLHTRFIPISVALFGMYLATGLLLRNLRRATLLRLGALALAYGVTLSIFAVIQHAMFIGGLPFPAGLLFSYPLGMWYGVVERLGLLSVLPLFAGMIGAAIWVLFRDPPNRRGAVTILLLSCIVLATSSTTRLWHGGECYPGRYLLVMVPLFVPFLARALGQASPVARWWVIFLGLIPCFQFLLVLLGLPTIGDLGTIYDHLNGVLEFVATGEPSMQQPLAVLLIVGTGLLLFLDPRRRRPAQALAAAMILVAVATGDVAYGARMMKFSQNYNARRLAGIGPRLEQAQVATRGDASALDLFLVSNLHFRKKLPAVIDRDAAPPASNDWAGRGYRWVNLVPPFEAGAGWRACRLTGFLDGGAAASWAVREGSTTLFEGPLEAGPDGAVAAAVKIQCRGRGLVSVVVRLGEGPVVLRKPAIAWTPFSQGLLEKTGFRL